MSIRSNTSFPPIETRGLGTASLVSNGLTVAAERWNVEKKRMEMDEDIEKFYNGKVAKCLEVDKIANERITKLYNDIYYKVKWSNPPLPVVYQKLFTDYCKHLLKEGTNVSFPGAADIKAWKKKMVGSIHDKVACEADKLCKTLRDTIQKRDTDLINIQAQLITTTEKKNIHKDGTLRWMMETNVGKKDEYFTVWYLAAHGKIRELDVLINAPSKQAHIDDRDPDFGLTPLHFACKTVKLSMVQYLMSKGADIHLRTPDGRTPLHLAAAYSTREVVLELLGACVDFDAVDNYGCTALHMAEQNRNSSTTETLRKWSTLTMLPSELEQLNSQQRSPEGSVQSPGLSAHKSFTGMDGNIGGTSAYSAAFPRSSAPEFHHQATVASEMQLTVFQNFDPNVPWEYQPIPADSLKLMSPSLSLLTKRLNAYNMFLIRTESNYVPTEMLSSRDLRNISGMLHRSATSLLQASQVSGEQYHSSLHSMGSSLLLDCGGNESVAQVPLVGEISFAQSESHVQSTKTESQLYIDTSASVGELCSNGEYKFGNESEMFRSSHQTENFDFSSEFNECLVEIRLTTKHYAQCVQENLIEEAMRSLRRRWMVAKRLWDLIVREKAQREHQEQLQRKEQETHMAALLADQEHYQMQYDEQGVPKVVVAGLLEYSSSVVDSRSGGDGACGLVRGSSEEDFNHKTGNSEDAVNLSAPHPKYAPSLAEGSEQSSSPLYSNTHNYDTNIALSPISVDVAAANFSVHSQFDIYPNIPPQEGIKIMFHVYLLYSN